MILTDIQIQILIALTIGTFLGLFIAWLIKLVHDANHPLHQKETYNLATQKSVDYLNNVMINEVSDKIKIIKELEKEIERLKEDISDYKQNTINFVNWIIIHNWKSENNNTVDWFNNYNDGIISTEELYNKWLGTITE